MNRQEFLLLTATACGAAIFGFLVGDRGSDADLPRSALAQEEPASLEPLLEEIRKLGSLMSELTRPPLARETAPRTALGTGDEAANAPDMVELLERCASLIGRMEQHSGASGDRTARLFLDSPGAMIPDLQLYAAMEEGKLAFNREHRLWSFQQIIDRYGTPADILNESSGVTWMYRITQPDGNQDEWSFSFAGGFVYRSELW